MKPEFVIEKFKNHEQFSISGSYMNILFCNYLCTEMMNLMFYKKYNNNVENLTLMNQT